MRGHRAGKPAAAAGVEAWLCEEREGLVDVESLSRLLGERGVDSVLLEGGGNLNFSVLRQGLVDELYAFVAPKIVGGADAKTPVEGRGVDRMADALPFRLREMRQVGEDVLLRFLK